MRWCKAVLFTVNLLNQIEHPTRGDDTRAWNPPSAPTINTKEEWSSLPPESAYFLSVNRNKKSLGVNLKNPDGLKIVHELIAKADILVSRPVKLLSS